MDDKLRDKIIARAEDYVHGILEHEATGHDWSHISRVTKLAIQLGQKEGADLFICELAALLHDLVDSKLTHLAHTGVPQVESWLADNGVAPEESAHIMEIITTLSFKGGGGQPMTTIEGKVVQDADRLDALGAIGIARAFTYSGAKGGKLHDPALKPRVQLSEAEYRNEEGTAINHFYEKLLKLKDRMNTTYGKAMAAERHVFMEQFLRQFDAEWEGEAAITSAGAEDQEYS
jgi:uncharacterized protein